VALGADLEVVSATKATAGHSDAVIGLARSMRPELIAKLRAGRTLGGAIPGVLEAWLCLRGLMTLDLRLAQASASALKVAERLAEWEARYPGLPGHPHFDLGQRQMRHCGPVLTFDLKTEVRAERFCAALRHIFVATSFGGVESSLERRARWGGDAVSPGLIRMSVGMEDPQRLLEDLELAISVSGAAL
jgi:cystathionine gamma-lyase